MRRMPAPRHVRRCRAGAGGWCAPGRAPLPVQGTPHAVPAEITGDPGARCTPGDLGILPAG